MPSWVHWEVVLRNVFSPDSTEAKMPAKAGSDRARPSRNAPVMEKSQTSCPPLAPRGTQTSARRREEMEGSGVSGSGGAIIVNGVSRDQEAWLFQDSSKVGPIVGGRFAGRSVDAGIGKDA